MFKPVQNRKIYQQVAEQIQKMIMDGSLKGGDRLPPEREMAELFKVSRTSIREAVRSLDILGLIECRQGGGNYIRKEFSDSFLEPLSIMFKLHNGNFHDILETRKILEAEATALAAQRMTQRQQDELTAIMDKLDKTENEEERIELDADFHFKIIEASGNYLVTSFYRAVSSIMKSFIVDARKHFSNKNKLDDLLQRHRDIYNALMARNPELASEMIRKHFDFVIDNSDN